MPTDDKLPARKPTLEELVAARDRAIKLSNQAFELLHQADVAYKAAGGCSYQLFSGFKHHDWGRVQSAEFSSPAEKVRCRLDAGVWTHMMRLTGMRHLLDASTSQAMKKQLTNPPEVSLESIKSRFADLYDRRSEIYINGLVNVFEGLHPFRSNQKFKFGRKVILAGALDQYGWASFSMAAEKVRDLERVFYVLRGEKMPENGTVEDQIYNARRGNVNDFDSEFFAVKLFKNGNIHLTFLDQRLVDQANRLLSEHYGAQLPAA